MLRRKAVTTKGPDKTKRGFKEETKHLFPCSFANFRPETVDFCSIDFCTMTLHFDLFFLNPNFLKFQVDIGILVIYRVVLVSGV